MLQEALFVEQTTPVNVPIHASPGGHLQESPRLPELLEEEEELEEVEEGIQVLVERLQV